MHATRAGTSSVRNGAFDDFAWSFGVLMLAFHPKANEPSILTSILLSMARVRVLGPFLPQLDLTRRHKNNRSRGYEQLTGLPQAGEDDAPLGTLLRSVVAELRSLSGMPKARREVLRRMTRRRSEALTKELMWGGWGIGRGVFDSTFRALAATLFPHQLEAIFAAVRFGEGLAAIIAFKLCPCVGGAPLTAIILVLGSAVLGCYWLAEHINGYPDTKGK